MQATSPFCSLFNVRRAGVLVSTALFVLLPFVIGAPTNDETMKQQIAQGLMRDDLWNSLNQELYASDPMQRFNPYYSVRIRSGGLDSLGRGNILRSLDGMGNDWGDFKGNSWRLGYVGGTSPKRGGSLDSLGRGNILRRASYDNDASILHSQGPYSNFRGLDSLGKGNILKRSVRVA